MLNCPKFSLRFDNSELPKARGEYTVYCTDAYIFGSPHGQFVGEIKSGDKVTLDFQPPMADRNWEHAELTIGPGDPMTLTGKASKPSRQDYPWVDIIKLTSEKPRATVSLRQYLYSFAPAFGGFIIRENSTMNGGSIKIDKLDNLPLNDPVRASARFYWHVDYNSAAQAITGNSQKSGVGIVNFRKQPDGKWVITKYRLEAYSWEL